MSPRMNQSPCSLRRLHLRNHKSSQGAQPHITHYQSPFLTLTHTETGESSLFELYCFSTSYAPFSETLTSWSTFLFPTLDRSNTWTTGYLSYTPESLCTYIAFNIHYDILPSFPRYLGPAHFPFLLLYLGALDVPILLGVILDSTVGAEFPHLLVLLGYPWMSIQSD